MRASKAADQNCTGTKIFDFYPCCIWIFNHSASQFYHNALHAHFFCWHFVALGLLILGGATHNVSTVTNNAYMSAL